MVEKIAPTSSTSPPPATHINYSTSIESDPDRAWIAERQAQIKADIERMNEEQVAERQADGDDQSSEPHLDHDPGHVHSGNASEDERLSGESPRIGTGNFDEEVPFGEHVGFL